MFNRQVTALRGFSLPRIGQILTWFVIWVAVCKAPTTPPSPVGERVSPVTIISFLPDAILGDPLVFRTCRLALVAAGALWGLQLMLPWSAWLTVGLFTATIALSYENTSHISHIFNLPNTVMFAHVLWYHFYHREIRAALKHGRFWTTKLYPNWVLALSVFFIAVFHSYAGFIKLWTSGPGWANGVSLQLWLNLWGRPESWMGNLILSDRRIATLFQSGTLIIECSAVLAVFSHRLRCGIGLALLGMYVGILDTFGFRFSYNAILVALLFLPMDTILAGVSVWIRSMISIKIPPSERNWHRQVQHFILSRFDIAGLVRK